MEKRAILITGLVAIALLATAGCKTFDFNNLKVEPVYADRNSYQSSSINDYPIGREQIMPQLAIIFKK